jgi:hypothetical protein
MRWPTLLCALAVAGGCGGDERDRARQPQPVAETRAAARDERVGDRGAVAGRGGSVDDRRRRPIVTRRARCDVGERPRYFVPHSAGTPLALVGCARLGVSGKRVEFSAGRDRIGRQWHSCIHPAYGGGAFIPAICALEPPLTRFAVHDASTPRQGVRGYGEVVWGSTGSADRVVVHYHGGSARAAILDVPRPLARRFGEPPFRLFVAELPEESICSLLTVTTNGSTETIRPSAVWCVPPTACRTARPGFHPPGHVTDRPARQPCPP